MPWRTNNVSMAGEVYKQHKECEENACYSMALVKGAKCMNILRYRILMCAHCSQCVLIQHYALLCFFFGG